MSGDRRLYAPDVEAASDWGARQDRIASGAVRYGFEHASEVERRLERAGVEPSAVRTVADLRRIPVLSKDTVPDLQAADPPFGGMLAVAPDHLARIFTSPGPILDPQGEDGDTWGMAPALWAAGFRPGQVALNTFSYHLTPAGLMMDAALRAVGVTVVPGGVGNTAAQIETARAAGVTGYVGTPQFLLTLLNRARDAGPPLEIERATVTGGPFPPAVREAVVTDHGVSALECYGTADAGCLGYECGERPGWHVAPGVVIEILDPATAAAVPAGEMGEVVVTKLDPAYPLVRFGTGDLSAFAAPDGGSDRPVSCPCGRTSPRLVGFLGRTGEGVKVKGMFVHPRQLDRAMATRAGVARVQAVVTASGHTDRLAVLVEPQPGVVLVEEDLARAFTEALGLRLTLQVVTPGTIEVDAPRVRDERTD